MIKPSKSPRNDWCTPPCVLDRVYKLGPVTLDPCSNAQSLVVSERTYRLDRGEDGLVLPWDGFVYVNPPYAHLTQRWVKRCIEQSARCEIVALVPARTESPWFGKACSTASAVGFWRGRITFEGAKFFARFPSAVIYWGPRQREFLAAFGDAFTAVIKHGDV